MVSLNMQIKFASGLSKSHRQTRVQSTRVTKVTFYNDLLVRDSEVFFLESLS